MNTKNVIQRLTFFFFAATVLSFAQVADSTVSTAHIAQANSLPNIAVLNFSGDETVTQQQLGFITGEFAAKLIQSKAFTVLDRSRMDVILKEQGFQQTGACNSSECKLQMGQLLGVDNFVAGSMVRFGPHYAFRIEYVNVATGQVIKTISFEKNGELYEVYQEACQQGADALVRYIRGDTLLAVVPAPVAMPNIAQHPKWKQPVVIGLLASGVLGGVLGYMEHRTMLAERKTYDNSIFLTRVRADAQWKKVTDAQSMRNTLYGVGAGLLATGLVIQFAF